MAVMLEHNAKNTNAANIFVNKLHGLVSEYAEVNHTNVRVHQMFPRILQLRIFEKNFMKLSFVLICSKWIFE